MPVSRAWGLGAVAGRKLHLGAPEAEARRRGLGLWAGSGRGQGGGGGGGCGEFALTGLVGEWPGSRRRSSGWQDRLGPDPSVSGLEISWDVPLLGSGALSGGRCVRGKTPRETGADGVLVGGREGVDDPG